MKNDNLIDEETYTKILAIILPILTIICLIIYISTSGFISHAATGINWDETLPYHYGSITYFNSWLNANGLYQNIMDSINNSNDLPHDDNDYVLVFTDFGFYGNEGNYRIYRAYFQYVPIGEFSNTVSNWQTTSCYYLPVQKPTYTFFVHFDFYNGFTPIVAQVTSNSNITYNMFGHSPTTIIMPDNITYNITYKVPLSFSKNFYDTNENKILQYDGPPSVNDDDDIIPEDSEKPVFDDYVPEWDNSPTFDNSSVGDSLESIFDISKWVGENLRDTITGTGKYLADSFDYAGQKIIDNIRNTINDVKDTVEDFKDSVVETYEYITEPISVSDLVDTVEGTNLYGTVNTVTTSVTTFTGNFNNLSTPETFKIPIHLENLPEEYFGIQTTQYFDLGWYSQFFPALRTFTWCFVTFGLFYTVISSFISMVKGG